MLSHLAGYACPFRRHPHLPCYSYFSLSSLLPYIDLLPSATFILPTSLSLARFLIPLFPPASSIFPFFIADQHSKSYRRTQISSSLNSRETKHHLTGGVKAAAARSEIFLTGPQMSPTKRKHKRKRVAEDGSDVATESEDLVSAT